MTVEDENQYESCKTICHYLPTLISEGAQNGNIVRSMFLSDLTYKSQLLSTEQKFSIMAELGALELEPFGFIKMTTDDKQLIQSKLTGEKPKYDVALVTVIAEEIDILLRHLRLDINEPTFYVENIPYWEAEIYTDRESRVSVLVAILGEAGNVPCALSIGQITTSFDVDTFIMAGIAAGIQGRVNIGDVVCAERVLDYERARLEIRRLFYAISYRDSSSRPWYCEVPREVKTEFTRLFAKENLEAFSALRQSMDIAESDAVKAPKLKKGTIAAGEKLVADGSSCRLARRD